MAIRLSTINSEVKAVIFRAPARLLILCVCALIGGCFGALKPGGTADPVADSTVQSSDGEATPVIERTPNPYLSANISVPGKAQAAFVQALAAMREQQWQKSEVLFQELTVEYPKLSGPWLNLGIIYRETSRPEQAAEAFGQAITVNADNLDAYNQLAVVKREQGKFTEAETLYLKALDVWPYHAESHRNIGILYDLYLGQFDKALFHFENYQTLQDEPDTQIAGWIIDLKRRLKTVAKAEPQS